MTTITTMLLLVVTTAIMTITTSTTTTTAMVMMALLLLLLLRLRLWRLMILWRYTEPIPMVEQMRANFYVRFHIFVVFAGQITTAAGRRFPATTTVDHRRRPVCTCCTFNVVGVVAVAAASASAAIQSMRLASLFVVDFHIS